MSTLKLDTLSNKAGTASVPSDTIVSGTAKAWVNFNGTGTVAIRRAFNVSTITDNGTGNYTVNFTTAMVDADYATVLGGNRDSTYGSFITSQAALVSSVQVKTWNISTTPTDWVAPCVAIFS